MPRKKKTTWTTLLIKKEYDASSVLRTLSSGTLRTYEVKDGSTVIGTLVVGPKKPTAPQWVKHVKPHVQGFPSLTNESVSAVLIVPSEGRLFALTFGYGRSLLVPDSWEDGFGLKVTLNAVPRGNVRAIDRSSFDAFAHQTKTQGIRTGELEEFGLDMEQDILRAIVGKPSNPAHGELLAGKDALVFRHTITVPELPGLLSEYLAQFQSKEYKKRYPDLDQLAEVTDPVILKTLGDALLKKIRENDQDRLWLAVPEFVDWAQVGFRYSSGASYEAYSDLHLDDFLTHVRDVDALKLEGRRVYCVDLSNDKERDSWALLKCVHCEVVVRKQTYVLSGGCWYKINQEFVEKVDRAIKPLLKPSTLPDYRDKSEAMYNKRVAATNGYFKFDRKNVHHGGGRSQIEPCDMLTPTKRMVHTKHYGGSSVLSHLFAQGRVSSEALVYDGEYRDKVRAKLPAAFKPLVPSSGILAKEFEVVYAIIGRPPGSKSLAELLPFFSRMNLRRTAQHLKRLGYSVTVEWVTNSLPKRRKAKKKT